MLSVQSLNKSYAGRHAVADVTFTVGAKEIVGLVGVSGSGKSTIGRCILGLERPESGRILWNGQPLAGHGMRRLARRDIQAVFQDPRSTLNPRWTVRRILTEPLDNWSLHTGRADRQAWLETLLHNVSLSPELLARYPHELSTGQCQRLCVARALAPDPQLLLLDEPLSALDVSVQARILTMFHDLHRKTDISFLVITHDFAVVWDICHRVVVMDAGRVVEAGTVSDVLDRPTHPATQALLANVLTLPFAPTLADVPRKTG